ncbi:type VII secretion-associated serine protease mycosin [Streptomyces beijiangensis]|uniref:Type VII secretion-associated serine protease mycosin n=1 Tax=Streptomyces beijiangensis TaxID=163361 RepID=A0A939F5A7_9ACTN|nr:type VII secretion-associated serine protease mycosin [Streptomyces beijiangensis]MBO0511287.1 type VII secretion-associated serine protease mycosin [Streptomyces beijiangensis]
MPRTSGTRALQRVFGVLAATGVCLTAAPAGSASASDKPDKPDFGLTSSSECVFGGGNIKPAPWSLQRILLDQMRGESTGKDVTVAVIDTGVDNTNKQLSSAIAPGGKDFVGNTKGTTDTEGHGTRVAGIIAARPVSGSGFAGIAPEAKILPIRYTGGEDEKKPGSSATMSAAIDYAVKQHASIINISSDTVGRQDNAALRAAVDRAVASGALIVAAAGNEGADGKSADTYPAAYEGVLAVAASDRNDERAFFSQSGKFVDVAAPGVGMISTVPKGGQCTADGTSFAAPYVAGVAALLKSKHPGWSAAQITTRIEESAKRTGRDRNQYLGWGVVDPIAALADDSDPKTRATADPKPDIVAGHVVPMAVTMGESEAERDQRTAMYVMGGSLVLVLVVAGSGVVVRDWRRKQTRAAGTGSL